MFLHVERPYRRLRGTLELSEQEVSREVGGFHGNWSVKRLVEEDPGGLVSIFIVKAEDSKGVTRALGILLCRWGKGIFLLARRLFSLLMWLVCLGLNLTWWEQFYLIGYSVNKVVLRGIERFDLFVRSSYIFASSNCD